jgi:hypothetical protein
MSLWPEPLVYLIEDDGSTSDGMRAIEAEMLIEEGEVTPLHYGFTEGMPGWRSFKEALIWARRPLASLARPVINEQVAKLLSGETSETAVRCVLREVLLARGIRTSDGEIEALQIICATELNLKRSCDEHGRNFERGAIDAFPAWELTLAHEPDFPRDWVQGWTAVGGSLVCGRMLALKSDPIWAALSDFGYPCQPFSFDRAPWLRDIPRTEAAHMGVRAFEQPPTETGPFRSVF